ncbi:HNH endonuclease [Rarobacter faecitabidus]|uniref:HNH endonuclease n=1 Tax=Rarobacter faecitabidus TaxID=13243 RepID=A0A542Z873_RARFA|nr:HNH endonuclease [Rarobacter faecitabidus]TQL56536.1 HNH endonuclease [Rarobacter faecitabidus]
MPSADACLLDGCVRPQARLRICNAHYLRATRAGVLDQVLETLPERECAQCGFKIAPRAKVTKIYCSQRCTNVANWQSCNKEDRAAKHRAWRDATRDSRIQKTRDRLADRKCEECGAPIEAQRSTRRFCSRKCINRRADRDNPHRRAELRQKRRKNLIAGAAPAGVTERDWNRLVRRYDSKCAYCGETKPLTVDHVVPISRGGRHSIGNVLPACLPCNTSKRDRLLIDWRTRLLPLRLAG